MNELLIEQFELLLKQINFDIDSELKQKDKLKHMYRYSSILRSLNVIRNHQLVITKGKDLEAFDGIGEGTIKRIDEILKTGKLSEIREEVLNNEYLKYVDELENVYGIGPKTALHLYKQYNIKSIEQLRTMYENKTIALSDTVAKGLKYYDKIKINIPRIEIDAISNLLLELLRGIDPQLLGVVCGSYRRLTMTSNDIDLLIVHPMIKTKFVAHAETNTYLHRYINRLIEKNVIIDSLTGIDVTTKYMGLCHLNNDYPIRRIDIRFIPYNSYYYSLMYFTGSREFNIKVRTVAIELGYTMNEYGIYDDQGEFIKANSEKEIFDILHLDFIPPENR